MDEKQFAGIRATWADRRELHDNQIDWLISAIEARDAIIYDLMIDHQKYVESGRNDAINEILMVVRKYRGECLKEEGKTDCQMVGGRLLGMIQAANKIIDAILAKYKLPNGGEAEQVPPSQARAEVDRLFNILKRIEEVYDGSGGGNIYARADRMAKLAAGAWQRKWQGTV